MMTSDSETKLEALRLVLHAQRFTAPAGYSRRQQGALIARFTEALGSRERVGRLCLASALLGRPVTSFSKLVGGEVKAMLDEPELIELLRYLADE